MKAGWQTKKLREVCELINGRAYKKPELLSAGKYPVLRVGNFFTSDHWYYSDLELEDKKYCDTGDLLYAWSASFGPRIWEGGKVIYHYHIWKIEPNRSLINQQFLFHFLLWDTEQIKKDQGTGTTMIHVSKGSMEDREILLPPLPEQERIVAILDEAFDGIAKAKATAEANLQNARALFQSHLQTVFSQKGEGWVEKTLGDICDFLNGFAFKSGDVVAESNTQLVRMGNLYGNQLDLDRTPVFYPDSYASEYSRYLLNEGDIIMSLTGTTGKEDYGFAVRIPDCTRTLLMNQRIMKFASLKHDIIDDSFLLHYLRSRCFLDLLYPTANGTRQANLSSVTMKLLPIPLCSLKEQKIIASKLDTLAADSQRLETLYQNKLHALDELKKSLLHQAFTGNL